jgi:hypothetical protein
MMIVVPYAPNISQMIKQHMCADFVDICYKTVISVQTLRPVQHVPLVHTCRELFAISVPNHVLIAVQSTAAVSVLMVGQ